MYQYLCFIYEHNFSSESIIPSYKGVLEKIRETCIQRMNPRRNEKERINHYTCITMAIGRAFFSPGEIIGGGEAAGSRIGMTG
jgi:hypothetical protein